MKKKSATNLDNPGFYIRLLHKFVRRDLQIFLVFIIHLCISNMATPLQAKPSTLVQFILKHAAASQPKIKAVKHSALLSSVFKYSVREVKNFKIP